MPPKKNKNAKKAGKDEPKRKFEEEPETNPEEEEVEYDSDGNEIVKDLKKVDLNGDDEADASSSASTGKLNAREIQKLKKKKQKGLLTEEEMQKYAAYLGVEERYAPSQASCDRFTLHSQFHDCDWPLFGYSVIQRQVGTVSRGEHAT